MNIVFKVSFLIYILVQVSASRLGKCASLWLKPRSVVEDLNEDNIFKNLKRDGEFQTTDLLNQLQYISSLLLNIPFTRNRYVSNSYISSKGSCCSGLNHRPGHLYAGFGMHDTTQELLPNRKGS